MAQVVEMHMKFYMVQNQEGLFFRAKGFGGGGDSWVEADKAKIYTKLGQARSRVTFFSKNYPKYGIPKIIEVEVHQGIVLEEEKRVKKAIADIQKKEKQYELQNLEWKRKMLEDQQKAIKAEIEKIDQGR